MGELHLEIICDRMIREFGCECTIGEPQVAYREALTKKAVVDHTHKKQTGGSGQYAKIKVEFSPLEKNDDEDDDSAIGEGELVFENKIIGGVVPKEYIPGVEKGIRDIMSNGPLAGFPVLGLRAALLDGGFHDVDSSVMAFEIAGRAATRKGLKMGGARLMEPVMKVEVVVPEEFMGDVIGDISSRRGMVEGQGDRGNMKSVKAKVPLATMFQYVSSLRSATKGRASYQMSLDSYAMVPPDVEKDIMSRYKGNTGDD
jgi:elongation factor G